MATNNTAAPAVALMLCALILCACGGGGDGGTPNPPAPPPPAATATGVFKDSNVEGLNYVSGGQTGLTGTDGKFTYEVGQQVTFKVGAVTLGSTAGKAFVTPVDLVANGSSTSTRVLNIVSFLMMLDSDGDARNGIAISSAVRARASSWPQVDFATTDLPSALATLIADAKSADGGTHTLQGLAEARTHLEVGFRCLYSGAFKGPYSGDDTGRFGGAIAPTGEIAGLFFSTTQHAAVPIVGNTPVTVDQNTVFTAGFAANGSTFNGHFIGTDAVSGTWSSGDPAVDGTFTGTRIGGSTPVYRFTAIQVITPVQALAAVIVFDVDSAGAVTATSYSPHEAFNDEVNTFIGGNLAQMPWHYQDPSGYTFTINLDTATMAAQGSFALPSGGNSGIITGIGCRLN